MPLDATELDRIREQLAVLNELQHAAAVRAGDPPRLEADAWRGPASEAYAFAASLLTDDLRAIVADLGRALSLARTELARALA